MGKKVSGAGYKRPPKDRCRKKGQSGSPRGRPPGHRNLAAALTAVLHENVSVPMRGENQEMTKLEAVTRQLVDKAMGGDARVMQQLLNEIHKNEAKAEREDSARPLGDVDREVIEALHVRSASRAVFSLRVCCESSASSAPSLRLPPPPLRGLPPPRRFAPRGRKHLGRTKETIHGRKSSTGGAGYASRCRDAPGASKKSGGVW
jgi:hypothetical protein